MQRVTNLESATNQNQKRFEVYNKRIADRFNEEYIRANYLQNHHQKTDVELWQELAGDDEASYEELAERPQNDGKCVYNGRTVVQYGKKSRT